MFPSSGSSFLVCEQVGALHFPPYVVLSSAMFPSSGSSFLCEQVGALHFPRYVVLSSAMFPSSGSSFLCEQVGALHFPRYVVLSSAMFPSSGSSFLCEQVGALHFLRYVVLSSAMFPSSGSSFLCEQVGALHSKMNGSLVEYIRLSGIFNDGELIRFEQISSNNGNLTGRLQSDMDEALRIITHFLQTQMLQIPTRRSGILADNADVSNIGKRHADRSLPQPSLGVVGAN